jgi:hypothetical protein
MKNVLTITSTLLLGAVLSLSACGKKPAANDPAAPMAADPAKPADPNAPAADPAKPADPAAAAKPAGGGW